MNPLLDGRSWPRALRVPLAVFILLSFPALLRAQTYSINWYEIGAGGSGSGTNSSNVVYAVSGSAGQPDASTNLSGGSYSVDGGFWSIALQTPGSPPLRIKVVDATHVSLLWPSSFAGFLPQQNAALGNTNWTLVATNVFPVINNGGTNSLTVTVSGNQYFRLQKQ